MFSRASHGSDSSDETESSSETFGTMFFAALALQNVIISDEREDAALLSSLLAIS
jgi:hypothetical protein